MLHLISFPISISRNIFLFMLLDLYMLLLAYMGIAIQDPCRPGVGDAVRLCQIAGVKVLIYNNF